MRVEGDRSRGGRACRSSPASPRARERARCCAPAPSHRARLLSCRARIARRYAAGLLRRFPIRSEEHTSELQSLAYLVCRLLLEKKKKKTYVPRLVTSSNSSLVSATFGVT